jgi:predicted metal-dependent peptidase
MTYERFSSAEFSKIASMMQEHHSIFSAMWHMGKPVFTERVSTACVVFDKEGAELRYEINKKFWDTQSDIQKCFVIAHESSHVFLNHGIRANAKIDDRANKAMDVVVNHSLVNNFGFDRDEIDPEKKYCWLDTVFEGVEEPIKENQSFEYYLNMIKKHGDKSKGEGGDGTGVGGTLVDDHQTLENAEKFLKRLGEELTEQAKEELKDYIQKHIPKSSQGKGDSAGGMEYLVPSGKVKKKRKWETVIKKWTKKFLNSLERDKDQWARVNRRFSMLKSDLMIPSEMEIMDDYYDDKKIDVYFFQDTSGSCSDFRDRFFTAAETLPTDRFDVKMHCFDTQVYETTLESRKLYGFGGTSFSCIEDFIQKHCKQHGVKYPAAVFVVTDGYGDNVHPEKPKNWHWFLSEPHTENIPKTSTWYNLQDYE